MLMVLSDGLSWRRASDPSFKAEAVLPHVMHMVHCLLTHPPAASASVPRSRERDGSRRRRKRTMKASRITALGLVAAATLWILSGHLLPRETAESSAAIRTNEAEAQKLFRVGVTQTSVVPHSRKLVLSGRTEADRRVTLTARTGGILTELRVRRGSVVKEGDVIAVLSDEAQDIPGRAGEIAGGAAPGRARSQAAPDRDRRQSEARPGQSRGPAARPPRPPRPPPRPSSTAAWCARPGPGWSATSRSRSARPPSRSRARICARIVALDPMLAVVEVSERKLAGIKVGDMAEVRLITGETARGKVRFVSKTASQTTRTYRVEIELPNADGAIPDGISADVAIPLAPIAATSVPRSALTFSSTGDHRRAHASTANGVVGFLPVSIIEDEQTIMWVGGVPDGGRVIVQGQDFVREGQHVEAVPAAEYSASR